MGIFTVRMAMMAVFLAAGLRGQDPDVSLVIRFAGARVNHFKVGEVIPVKLSFSASIPGKYRFNTASYDRSGRLGIEEFEVEPKGRDPLASYYRSLELTEAGGFFGLLPLDSKPQVIQRDLNEWVALDRPGRYTVHVISSRVGHVDSNTLEFYVEAADAAWQKQTLSRAVAVLDNPASVESARRDAEETLRYLDCPESVRELARQLTKPGDGSKRWNFEAGLLGARDQDLVRKEMEARMVAPDAALEQSYLWLLARMELGPDFTDADYEQAVDEVYQRAADAVAFKQGAAKASTVAALLRSSPEQAARLPEAEIVSAFPLLDREQQELILGTFPQRVRVLAMADPLAAILDQPNVPGGSLRTDALQALLKVNPQMGRARMLAEMRAPHADSVNNPRFLIRCLSQLPDAALPELDNYFAERLEEADYPLLDLYAGLTGRYATEAIRDRVKRIYQDRIDSWDCAGRDGIMRYFLRVDPDFAVGVLKETGAFCADESLKELVRLKRWPEVQPAIIRRLDDPDAWVARDAADVLGKLGDGAAKEALLARLRVFHDRWKPRADEFREFLPAAREISDAEALQEGLIQALTESKGWKLSDAEKAEVKRLEF